MKELINKEDFIAAANLQKFRMEKAAHPLMRITGVLKLNALYDSLLAHEGLDFVEAFFKEMEIEILVDHEEMERIPAKGPFITISNHPFGAVDGLTLLKLCAPDRPDYKIMANFLLQHIEPIHNYFIPVNPFETHQHVSSSLLGMKKAIEHLNSGGSLGLFPAGEVSSFQNQTLTVTDRAWQRSMIKFIKNAGVPIVPIYFQGTNSVIFHLLGLVHPRLRTAILPAELFKKKRKVIRVRVGNPIHPRDLRNFSDLDQFGRFLRAKTYALGSALEVRKFFRPNRRFSLPRQVSEVASPINTARLEAEIEGLREHNLVLSQQNFEGYIAQPTEIPLILQEIGRLREITFRAVGEGTNRPMDTDEYDLYYYHLFLWDTEAKKVVGAYRLGKGDDIVERFGKKGFYIHSLFRIDEGFLPILGQSVELGRSFISQEYQQKRLPLFLLWKGIVQFLKQHPECRYIIGPVSISNNYSKVSRSFMVEFIEKYYFDYEMASLIEPRHAFRAPRKKPVDTAGLLEGSGPDLKKIDKIISDIEPSHMNLPVLLKKYISQNARIIGFNVDPKFNDCLDGLMICDIQDLPESSVYHME